VDDQVLTILNLVLERIDMGINQVDLYIGKNSAYVNPITGYGYSGDAVRKRLQEDVPRPSERRQQHLLVLQVGLPSPRCLCISPRT
jgi:hypothetical protein